MTAALAKNSTLTKLYLGKNKIHSAGIASLFPPSQTSLTEVSFWEGGLTDADMNALMTAFLQTNHCPMKQLWLAKNPALTDNCVANIVLFLNSDSCQLTRLHLEGNNFSDGGKQRIQQAWHSRTPHLYL
jgi:hypothetical protein